MSEITKGTILVSKYGFRVRVWRVRKRDDQPDEIVVESLRYKDADGTPVKLSGHYTMADIHSGLLRVEG